MASFGNELRVRRNQAGMSLSGLAGRTFYSRGHLSKVENGLKDASPALARLCDAALNAGGALAALAPAETPTRRGRQIPALPAEPGPVGGLAVSASGLLVPQPDPGAPGLSSWFFPGSGAVSAAAEAAAADESSLPRLAAMFEQNRLLGHQFSPRPVLDSVRALTTWTRALALNAADPRLAARFGLLAAWYAEYAGWMTQELGDDRGAEQWTQLAVSWSATIDGADLSGYALIRAADIALYREDPIRMIEVSRQAQAGTLPRVGRIAAQREAQGHALLGDLDACLRALDRAGTLAAASERDGGARAGGITIGGTSVPDELAIVTGWAMVDVGRPALAAEILDREVPRISPVAIRARARYGLRQALAHAMAGNLDRSVELLNSLVADIAQADSATIRVDLRRVVHELARWRNHAPTVALLPRLSTVLRAPYSPV